MSFADNFYGKVRFSEETRKVSQMKHFQNSILSLTNQTLNNSVRLACGDYESKRRLGSGFGLLFRETLGSISYDK